MSGSAVVTAAMPGSYDELFREDGDYISKMVRRQLGPAASPGDVEDTSQYIAERLLARDVLAMYDPGDPSGASWRTFLGRQVILYCRGRREDLGRHAVREPAQCDAPAGDGQSTWIDLYGPGMWDDYPSLDDDALVARIRSYLETVPESWQPGGPLSLSELFESVLSGVRGGVKISAAHLGVSQSQAKAGLTALRRALQPAVRRRVVLPAAYGLLDKAYGSPVIDVTRDQVAEAIEILEGSTAGTAVRQPLKRAGSPLAAMDYHAIASAEAARFSKLRKEGGSRGAHVGHVKAAVLHRLRRLLAEEFAPAFQPDPDPEPTVAEQFESELWHFPGMTPEKVDQLMSMARQLAGT